MDRRPRGPRGLPLLGALLDLRRDAVGFLERMARDHGDVVPFHVGGHRAWLVAHPDLAAQVLRARDTTIEKDRITHELSSVLGQGLLTNEGASWRRQRRRIAPSFTPRQLSVYGQAFVGSLDERLPALRGVRDVHEDLTAVTLHIVLRTLFGTEPDGEAAEVGPALDRLMASFEKENRSLWRLIPEAVPAAHRREVERSRAAIDAIVGRLVARARSEGTVGRDDLLARLLEARDDDGGGMSDGQLRDELMTLFLAGHETTALALAYTCWLLAEHPEAQARLHSEVDRVLGGRAPTPADLPDLPQVDAAVREAMRLYPPAWAIGRQTLAPLRLGGVTVPAGHQITLSPWVMQRDPRWWVGATRFRPDRWLDGETETLPRMAYLPFGGGPRVCVGQHFAQMELVLVLARLLQHRTLAPVPGFVPTLVPAVTLRPRRGIWIRLDLR